MPQKNNWNLLYLRFKGECWGCQDGSVCVVEVETQILKVVLWPKCTRGCHFQSNQNAVVWLTGTLHGKRLNWFYGLPRFKGVQVSQTHKFNGKLCFLKATLRRDPFWSSRCLYYYVGNRAVSPKGPFAASLQDTHWKQHFSEWNCLK